MNGPNPHRFSVITIFVLAVLLIVACIFLFKQYRKTAHFQAILAERSSFENLFHHKMLTANNVDYIQSWMTFGYVNIAFKLPADYLKTALNVTGAQYPRVTIGKYAKSVGTSSQGFTILVQNEVRAYLSTTTATTTLSE